MTAAERRIFWSVAIVSAVARFASRARSLWEWDEALFCLGMRSYDVTQHHPHPPGFPAYIALGRIVRLFVHDDFRSLQSINLVAGMLLFPAVFLFARAIGVRFSTSVIAGAICAFLPNVWFYGGTAFSDVPSITLAVFAAALIIRGERNGESYLAGVLLMAIAIGIRPQNALIGLFPLLYATRRRSRRDIAFAALIGIAIVGSAFFGAAAATGSFDAYRDAVRTHSEYITQVDSFHNPLRPPLWRLVALFFGKIYGAPALDITLTILVIVSLIAAMRSRDRPMLYNALTFGPVAIASWLFLDRYSATRFAIGYIPMFAIFAADGITRIARQRSRIEAVLAVALVIVFAAFALPAFTSVRRDVAPTILAVDAASTHFNASTQDLYVASDMSPFVDYFAPALHYTRVIDERAVPIVATGKEPELVAEVIATEPAGYVFRRERGNLWNISRRHYFGAGYFPVRRSAEFLSGWYPGERSRDSEWRWMAARSTMLLPPSAGETLLRLDLTADSPTPVTLMRNAVKLDTFTVDGDVRRQWHIDDANAPTRLVMITNRDHAIRLRALSWAPY